MYFTIITTRTNPNTLRPQQYVTDFLLRMEEGLHPQAEAENPTTKLLQYEKCINKMRKQDDNWGKKLEQKTQFP